MTSHFDPPALAPDQLYRDIDAIFAKNRIMQKAASRRRTVLGASLAMAITVALFVPGRASIDDLGRRDYDSTGVTRDTWPEQGRRAGASPSSRGRFEKSFRAGSSRWRTPTTRTSHSSDHAGSGRELRDAASRGSIATAAPQHSRPTPLAIDGTLELAPSEPLIEAYGADRPRIAAASQPPPSVLGKDAGPRPIESASPITVGTGPSEYISDAIDAIRAQRRQ